MKGVIPIIFFYFFPYPQNSFLVNEYLSKKKDSKREPCVAVVPACACGGPAQAMPALRGNS
ncbi:hypothetical protein BFP75_02420 [Maribacter sp. 4G9]|nr:hypothetical protein BFP75_02420 [Maribacter sp. 4G9]